jgi:HAD superfamily hydrolase (TIGR01509 family)
MKRLLVFDFDGVLADSELLANAVLADIVTELGVPTTTDDALRIYTGKRFPDVISTIEATVGRKLAPDFTDSFQARTFARFREALQLVRGARAYLDEFADVPHCIASSSSPDRLAFCLDLLGLGTHFEHVFSASHVARGKPHPDIFLHASERMGVPPADALVIEDSPGGVRAAVAAGMTVIGLLAASHVRAGHEASLREAGATYLAQTYADAAQLTRSLVRQK